MNPVSIIIVGVNEWERYTLPCIKSLQENDPGIDIICIDNFSNPQYPEMSGVTMLHTSKLHCYASALNIGLKISEANWNIVSNNDMIYTQKISDRIVTLKKDSIYGFIKYSNIFHGVEYLAGWCLFIPREVYFKVGEFDEKFAPMWFEDADYSHRAVKAGIKLIEFDRKAWGIRHIEDERMGERKSYMASHMEARQRNREYMRKKHGLR